MTPLFKQHLRANALMLFAAMIWGSAFVAQRMSLSLIGPFLYTGFRFLLGALIVLVFMSWQRWRGPQSGNSKGDSWRWDNTLLGPGILIGAILAVALGFQQVGLKYTLVANAGFISSLYVVLVPLISMVLGHRTGPGVLIGAILAAAGLYFMSITSNFTVMSGDWLQLGCAFAISFHVLLIGYYAPKHDPLELSIAQFLVCGALSLLVGLFTDPWSVAGFIDAIPTIIYGGALSVGIGYTIQVIAQRHAAPSHAAIIFSMEGVFAAIAGWLVLSETLTPRAILGCALMLGGLLVCQLVPAGNKGKRQLPTAPQEPSAPAQ